MVESFPYIEYCGSVYVHQSVVFILIIMAQLLPIADFVIVHLGWPLIKKKFARPRADPKEEL